PPRRREPRRSPMPPIGIHPTTPPQERLQGDRPRLPGRGSDERGSQSRPSLNVRQPGTPGTCQARYCGRRPSPKCGLCCAEQHSLGAVLANFLEELADRLIVADVEMCSTCSGVVYRVAGLVPVNNHARVLKSTYACAALTSATRNVAMTCHRVA